MDLERVRAALRGASISETLAAPSIRLRPTERTHPPGRHARPQGSRPCRGCRRVEATEFLGAGSHVAVAAGGSAFSAEDSTFSLALTADGDVRAWGDNNHGQLGDGTTRYAASLRTVGGLEANVCAIAAGAGHSLALTIDGAVLAWGDNWSGQLATGEPRGATFESRLKDRHRLVPGPVVGLPGRAIAIAAGENHSLALLEDGAVMIWGAGLVFGLDAGSPPVEVATLSEIVAISAGRLHNFALDKNGQAWAWGSNRAGLLGDGTTTDRTIPVRVTDLPATPAAIIAGDQHSLALIEGRVWTWGWDYQQHSFGTEPERSRPTPVEDPAGGIVAITARGHTLALREDGSVWGWGSNGDGQLGNATVSRHSDPQQVSGLGGGVEALAAGEHHTLALRRDGTVVGWGGAYPPNEWDQEVPVGQSKLGGQPDLPEGIAWPASRGVAQLFVAQVNLADVAPLDEERLLPAVGLLSFFVAEEWWNLEPGDSEPYQVLFTEDPGQLGRLKAPAEFPDAAKFTTVGLAAELEPSLAPIDSAYERELIHREALNSYTELLKTLGKHETTVRHRMLGYPDPVQNDPRLECEARTRGLDVATAGADSVVRAKAADWCLLLQVDSDSACGMEWSDAGRLYYLIRKEDLAARRFDRVRGIDQSH